MLFFCIGKHTLDFLLSQFVEVAVLWCMPDILSHFHEALPDMPRNSLFALGILCTQCPCGTILAQVGAAFVFPVAVPVGSGIVQRFIFRANHIVKVFIVDVVIPGMAAFFGFGAGIGRSQNSAAFKDSLANPGCFVGAIRGNDFVFGIMLADIIV